MKKRVKVDYVCVSADPTQATYTAHYRGFEATKSANNVGNAKSAAREAVIAKWQAAGSPEPAPDTVRSNPVPQAPVQVPNDPQQLMGMFMEFMAKQLGVSPAVVQAPVQVPEAKSEAPTAEAPKAESKLVAPPDPKWYETRADAIFLVRGLQKELGFKVINGKGFKDRIDKFMAQHGCEPVYEGRSKSDVNRLNTAGSKLVQARLRVLKDQAKAA